MQFSERSKRRSYLLMIHHKLYSRSSNSNSPVLDIKCTLKSEWILNSNQQYRLEPRRRTSSLYSPIVDYSRILWSRSEFPGNGPHKTAELVLTRSVHSSTWREDRIQPFLASYRKKVAEGLSVMSSKDFPKEDHSRGNLKCYNACRRTTV